MLLVTAPDVRLCIPALVIVLLLRIVATIRASLRPVVVGVSLRVSMLIICALVVALIIMAVCTLGWVTGLVLDSIIRVVVLVLDREGRLCIIGGFGSRRLHGRRVSNVSQMQRVRVVVARVVRVFVPTDLGLEVARGLEVSVF